MLSCSSSANQFSIAILSVSPCAKRKANVYSLGSCWLLLERRPCVDACVEFASPRCLDACVEPVSPLAVSCEDVGVVCGVVCGVGVPRELGILVLDFLYFGLGGV